MTLKFNIQTKKRTYMGRKEKKELYRLKTVRDRKETGRQT
jgi:hypothetical protein